MDLGGLPHSERMVEIMDLVVELGCKVHLPINYLVFSFDGNHHSLASWVLLVDKFKSKDFPVEKLLAFKRDA